VSTYDIRFWDIRRRDRKLPYQLRWTVAGRQHSQSFATKALAESYRADLVKAARNGEAFDEVTGLPESWGRRQSWFDHARDYAAMKWPKLAAKSRKSMVEALATVTPALLSARRGRPDDRVLRRALYGWAFNPDRKDKPPADVADALAWAEQASIQVSALRDSEVVRKALDALARSTDGKAVAATVIARKRAVFYNALRYAVERKLLAANPLDVVDWKAPEVAETVDRRVVASPDQVRDLLAAVRKQGRRGAYLEAFFGCLYFAGMRPSEAIALREADCWLPDSGWGRLDLSSSEPRAGALWTDDGQPREARGLKRRAATETRSVPIPPELIRLLRAHIDRFGVGEDSRLFRTATGGALQDSSYTAVWRKARTVALTPAQVVSPLARRPYDLRHAAASLWLNAGVPATEVARRLGHSVAMLLKVYANCIDGDEAIANLRIAAVLNREAGGGPASDPGADQGSDVDAADQSRTSTPDKRAEGGKTADGGLA